LNCLVGVIEAKHDNEEIIGGEFRSRKIEEEEERWGIVKSINA